MLEIRFKFEKSIFWPLPDFEENAQSTPGQLSKSRIHDKHTLNAHEEQFNVLSRAF